MAHTAAESQNIVYKFDGILPYRTFAVPYKLVVITVRCHCVNTKMPSCLGDNRPQCNYCTENFGGGEFKD